MIPGTVDPRTGNVPLHLDAGYTVHFEGRTTAGRVLVRLARRTTGPVNDFSNAVEVHEHVAAALPTIYKPTSLEEVAQWLQLRVAEHGASRDD